jgi:hypothetical protein
MRFCDEQEIQDYTKLKEKINDEEGEVGKEHMTAIMAHILTNRTRYSE